MENITTPIQEPPIIIEKPKTNYFNLILISICFVLFIAGAYYLGRQSIKIVEVPADIPTTAPVAVLPKTTVVPTPAVVDQISNWKTYTNIEYGYQINYPDTWAIKEDKMIQGLALISTSVISPSQNLFLDIWVRSLDWNQIQKEVTQSTNKKEINGIEMYYDNKNTFTVPSKNPKQVIQIIYHTQSDSSKSELFEIDQILSTFKFTESKTIAPTVSAKTACVANKSFQWSTKYNECYDVSYNQAEIQKLSDLCDIYAGKFDATASSCRHVVISETNPCGPEANAVCTFIK